MPQALGLVVLAGLWLGCQAERAQAPREPARQLVVFAAASLRESFTALGADFERSHPGVQVRFNFAGSQALRTQLEQGAEADVFASADLHHAQALADADRVHTPQRFARNEPVVVVAPHATSVVGELAELVRVQRVVIGAPEVPIGRYTQEILERAAAKLGDDFRAQLEARVVSRELNVRQVLAKVLLGEADAGIVYRTDALSAPGLTVRSIAAELNVVAEYPVAVVAGAREPALARAWVERLRSAEGQRALARAGFLPTTEGP